ncbi:MAG TPA: 3-hydroxyacyl-CoA dehydrogenase NAD-binding domain-containing protein [Gaiellaceae bacterium]|nr:3-hydroxyacyl-CoA dehydrogenase NAD-binding domain-containing protein [Gaiellaceae bacterium]
MPDTEFKLARAGDVALVTIDNGEDHTKPTFFGRAALASLERALDELERGDYAALVLTGKPFVFCAGADVTEFPGATAELAREGSRVGHELFGRLAALPYPTVAAINGVCLGGGLEIALHCDARTISSAVRHVGFPEVFLGIIPAWGGTQLVPRLVGVEAAVKVIVSNPLRQNRLLDAAAAVELGLADRLFEPAEFLDQSIAFALELAAGLRIEPGVLESDVEDVLRRACSQVDDAVHGAAPAPYRALDLIGGACSRWSLEEGYRAEEDAVAELLPGPQAQASLYAFDLVERRAKRPPPFVASALVHKIEKVGIVGAGLMARQIATLVLRRLEVPVVLRDVSSETVEDAVGEIHGELDRLAARGRYDEGKAGFLKSIVSGSTGYDGFADCDLVLEAVFEELDVKKQVFAEVEELLSPECVLATNTSSLSVTDMAAVLRHPQRVVGMHFFNPVALMPLLEVVRADETDRAALATAYEVGTRLRKRMVVVRDAPGFVVNRVLTRMTRVLMDALEHGNTIEETDEAILGLGMPMAPSVLLAMVGPGVANHVLETLHAAFPERFPLSPALANLAKGEDEIIVVEHAPRTVEEIREDVLEAIADEIRRLLDEGVVPEAADVDTALLLGAGWPFFLGGITKHLDQTGISERLFGTTLADVRAAAH